MSRKRWTENETTTLRERYPHAPTQEIAAAMGRTEKQVYTKARAIGLKKSAEYVRSQAAGRIVPGSNIGGETRFKQGREPWNKGMKGFAPKNYDTRFKKGERRGQALRNVQPVGTENETTDGYLKRKVSDTGCKRVDWKMVHNLEWEKHNGPIPKGHIVVFRDGDKKNTDISNLELISRAENMRRNSVHRYPPELVKVIQVKAGLQRRINDRRRQSEKQD